MIFRQIRSTDGSGTLSYLLADEQRGMAAVIDPNLEDVDRIGSLADELGVRITHVFDTHTHADHVSGAGKMRELHDPMVIMHENTKNKWKIVDQGDRFGIGDILRANAAVEVDRYVVDGDVVEVGGLTFKVLFTPGHTDNHISLLVDDHLFTGDLLLIGQAGRSDLPGGNPEEQYDSLFTKITTLPDWTKIFPGHDYEENAFAYLGEEKKSNPFLGQRTKQEYLQFVTDFFPPLADSVDGKVVLQCGTKRVTQSAEGVRGISAADLSARLHEQPDMMLLDVREPFELVAFGAIPGVTNIPIGQIAARVEELPADKNTEIVSICQSGNRSFEVAHFLAKKGYSNVLNLDGGTSAWIRRGLPVTKNQYARSPR
ncbi:MAG: MBL fold metallo-hydrolase [Ignavibacteria bacterium]|nr:MBL fold metallo-hydrolase [Ignavibacteria bacterium]